MRNQLRCQRCRHRAGARPNSRLNARLNQLAIGPAGEVYREAGPKAARLFDTLVAALKDELKQFVRPEGVMMNSSSWMVTVQNPGSPPRPRG
ncbi:hypothetical protein [Bradyrhizobium canariense]|uniref:hypothetical protein n=1 Tax=Bradyrhizobium canariense TaxID=255045 RepID=UPI001178C8E7|nr:hypothetical protein [Bradyrhizobium canariense]